MTKKVVNSAKENARKNARNRIFKITLVVIILFLINLYVIFSISSSLKLISLNKFFTTWLNL